MAYVFGIEGVPIFEMMLVFCLLLLGGLIVILIELKKLKKLISFEQRDVLRFERDLAFFERKQDENKNIPNKLSAYVNYCIAKGMSKQQIRKSLLDRGWSDEQVNALLNE